MCLIDKKKNRISSRKIYVWKIIRRDLDYVHRIADIDSVRFPVNYRTPFQNMQLPLVLKELKGGEGEPVLIEPPEKDSGKYKFEGGFIHAFSSEEKVKKILDAYFGTRIAHKKHIIIKGYIPPLTRYARGTDGTICARRIVFDEVLPNMYVKFSDGEDRYVFDTQQTINFSEI